jgi:hypothetical protein
MKTDNELIAEFMGLPRTGEPDSKSFVTRKGNTHLNSLEYHTSWDWLMPVVEKIHKSKTFIPWHSNEPMGVMISIHPNACSFNLPDPSEGYDYVEGCYEAPSLYCHNAFMKDTLTCVYECCVHYIKWYNSQEQKQH